jgi:hypothetical protein
MLFVSRVLWNDLCIVTQLPRPFENYSVSEVLAVVGVDPHPLADPVQRGLKFRRREEWQTRVGPLLSHVALSLKRGAPIDSSASSPGRAGQDCHVPVFRRQISSQLEHMAQTVSRRHWEVAGRIVIRFLDHEHAMSRFCEIFGRDTASAATANDDDIGLYRLGLIAWRELQKLVVERLGGLPVDRHPGHSNNRCEHRTVYKPCLFC